jgi:hypothetical protein
MYVCSNVLMYRLLTGKIHRMLRYEIVTNVVVATHQSFCKLWRFYHIHSRIGLELPTRSHGFGPRSLTSGGREEIGEEPAGG